MRKLIRATVALGFVAALPAASIGQQLAATAPTSSPLSSQAAPDPVIDAQWAAAEATMQGGDYRVALSQFEAIARIQEEKALNATLTYWKIAEIHNALANFARTAQALDSAAREANRFGDMDTHVRALYEAAIAYSEANQVNRATQRIRRVQGLLDEPGVTEATRASLRARMGMR